MLAQISDCTTPLEDAKLLYAQDYMKYVSSGIRGLGAASAITWPPGARPEPYSWRDPRSGIKWTLVMLDGKWMYQDGTKRQYISPSNIYDLMGVKKSIETGNVVLGQNIPGTPNTKTQDKLPAPPTPVEQAGITLSTLSLGGLSAGWLIVLGVGGYMAYKTIKKKRLNAA